MHSCALISKRHEVLYAYAQSLRDPLKVVYGDILFPAFDMPDVGSVHVCNSTKFVLGETSLLTDSPYVQANAFNNAAHEAIIDHIGQLIHEIISSNL